MDIQTQAFRNTDPETSALAADHVTATGVRGRNQIAAANAVAKFPGKTSRELATLSGLDRYELARRLPEVEVGRQVHKGAARTCSESGRLAVTWWPGWKKAVEP